MFGQCNKKYRVEMKKAQEKYNQENRNFSNRKRKTSHLEDDGSVVSFWEDFNKRKGRRTY